MTKRERVEKTYGFGIPDRPPFVPAVYEHKAALVGRTPSEVCRDGGLLHEALLRELEIYDPDVLTVGIDVYNVEAEALGCRVRYFEDSNDVPAVASPLLGSAGGVKGRAFGSPLARGLYPRASTAEVDPRAKPGAGLPSPGPGKAGAGLPSPGPGKAGAPAAVDELKVPDPESDGRMPLFLETAGRLHRELGSEVRVRGAVSGPFSLACALMGTEEVLVGTADDPASIARLLDFCGRVTVAYGKAFRAKGVDVAIFDSKASPGAASPRIFHDLVLPVYRDLVMPGLSAAGARPVPLIIGGDTTPILDDLLLTGATQLLCDAGADLEAFKKRCREERRAFRVSVDARLIHRGRPDEIRAEALRLLGATAGQPGLLFGCGVVAYDTDPANVLALRAALDEFSAGIS